MALMFIAKRKLRKKAWLFPFFFFLQMSKVALETVLTGAYSLVCVAEEREFIHLCLSFTLSHTCRFSSITYCTALPTLPLRR